ncbi:MAG: TraB/GumN family protein, partial [Gammaproteobacteria bacterium]|nr:TraB/GumN family protein [Gammaproteobacteria bacterium]
RNVKMTGSIKSYLKQKGRYFVVVGAGHLIGDKGIVQLLQNAGYRITRL